MKIRVLIDLLALIMFMAIGAFFAYHYLNTKPQTTDHEPQKSAQVLVTDQRLLDLVNTTPPANPADSWYPQRLSNRWQSIEIYQSGLLSGNAKTLTKRAGQNSALQNSFHFIITNGYGGKDGKVIVQPIWLTQEASVPVLDNGKVHANNPEDTYNTVSICLIGDFTSQPPTQAQIASLKALINYLLEATTIKSYNIHLNSLSTEGEAPLYLPLPQLIKTRLPVAP